MKRKSVWLSLSLMIMAPIFAAKWYVENPTPTQYDIALRKAIIESPCGYVTFLPPGRDSPPSFPPPANHIPLARSQSKQLCSYLFRVPNKWEFFTGFGRRGGIRIVWYYKGKDGVPRRPETDYATRRIEIDLATSEATFAPGSWISARWCVYPTTTRHMLKVLLSDPRIGPELRARLKS